MFCENKIDSFDFSISCKNRCEKYKSNNNIKITTKKVSCDDCITNEK